jgi:hypothetical protein
MSTGTEDLGEASGDNGGRSRLPRPAPHPSQPLDLADHPLPLREIAPPWFRSHRADLGPIYFGRDRTRGRFNDPFGEYGVLYLGLDEFAAFIETFGASRTAAGPYLVDNVVTDVEIAARCLCVVRSSRSASVVDLASGHGLSRLNADARLGAGDWSISQRWSRAFWEHPSRPDGLLYRSRHDPTRLYLALFDRESDTTHSAPTARPTCWSIVSVWRRSWTTTAMRWFDVTPTADPLSSLSHAFCTRGQSIDSRSAP